MVHGKNMQVSGCQERFGPICYCNSQEDTTSNHGPFIASSCHILMDKALRAELKTDRKCSLAQCAKWSSWTLTITFVHRAKERVWGTVIPALSSDTFTFFLIWFSNSLKYLTVTELNKPWTKGNPEICFCADVTKNCMYSETIALIICHDILI